MLKFKEYHNIFNLDKGDRIEFTCDKATEQSLLLLFRVMPDGSYSSEVARISFTGGETLVPKSILTSGTYAAQFFDPGDPIILGPYQKIEVVHDYNKG